MAARKSGVVRFARDRKLDVAAINARARFAVDQCGEDGESFSDGELVAVMGSTEHAQAYQEARKKRPGRYG